ncbi:DM13 domain-containing protein, partial [Intrasporangium sp.]|uniref:DM13 domain-containing protein n=1 Tax=Intrasporangium sp. TaxID=1925024 RepID=UPI00336582D1
AVVAAALFQPWRLLTRSTVDEALPMVTPSSSAEPGKGVTSPRSPSTVPDPEQRTLATGTFIDGEHPTSGRARVLALPDGSVVLRLEDFSTSDGPDVHVWLTDQPAGRRDWGRYDDGRYVRLGPLKGTNGNQNYRLPDGVDLHGLTSVVIWCDRFNVAFGSAALTAA